RRQGLMRLFGTDVRRDPRYPVGWARDISVLSRAESVGKPPHRLTQFPQDLADSALEYSGIYEDGWVAEEAYVVLAAPAGRPILRIAGDVPGVGDLKFVTSLRVAIDGREVARRMVSPGRFEIVTAVSTGSGAMRVSLHFSRVQSLPGADGRDVAARLRAIAFDLDPAASA